MIVVRLKGGLGNQMFQYALGRSLVHEKNRKLGLDISQLEVGIDKHSYRKYALDAFCLPADLTIDDFSGRINPNLFSRYFNQKRNLTVVSEKKFYHFDDRIVQSPDNSYLDGYWQCVEYFNQYKDVISKDFSFKDKLSPEGEVMAEKIRGSESVSIHIRRGDYISNPDTTNYHGICGTGYYLEAIRLINEKVSNPVFFIFSDDPDWVDTNFKPGVDFHIVSKENGKSASEELNLMTLCKHAIIANSSYSWWGAWLMNNPGKVVVSPKRWIKDSSVNTDDLFPGTWIRI